MANKRFIDKAIIGSLRFLKMGKAAQALYMHIVIESDDEGVTEAGTVLRVTQTRKTALKELVENGFVTIIEPSENIVYTNGWHDFNHPDTRYARCSNYHDTLQEHFPNIKLLDNTGKKAPKPTSDTRKVKLSSGEVSTSEVSSAEQGITNDTLTYSFPPDSTEHDIPTSEMVYNLLTSNDFCLTDTEAREQTEAFISLNQSYNWNKLKKMSWGTLLRQFLNRDRRFTDEALAPRIAKAKKEAERKAEEKRLRSEEEAKHWQGDTYFTSGQDFVEYLKGRKWTKYDEYLANDLYWMSEYTETEFKFDHDDNAFTEAELIEMFESGIITVDMQVGIVELFHEPDIAICQNDALVAKIRKQQASYKPTQKPPKPKPFIPNPTAFDDLQ